MQGKICLVTGATSGIGLVTARELARQGAHVMLVGRNAAKTTAIVAQIQAETGKPEVEEVPSTPASHDEAAAQRLWRVSQELTSRSLSLS